MKNKSFIIAIAIVGVFLALFVLLKNNFKSESVANQNPTTESQETPQFRMTPYSNSELIKPHSIIKGSPSAKVTIVEFLDPECEACAAMSPLLKKVVKEFEADVQLVVRYMPLHKNSKYVANILEGARVENKFWEALELLFETQGQWADHHNPQPELIPDILKSLKLNTDQIIADAKAGKYDKQIDEDAEDAKKVGIRGTPTFFVNGSLVQELGYEGLKEAVQSQLVK